MSNDSIIRLVTDLGYSPDQIRRLNQALDEGAPVRASVDHTDMTELTPMKAAAKSPRHRRILEQTRGMIRHLSAQSYDLPLHKPVDLWALNAALKKGNGLPEDRMAVKANLAQLGLC